MLRCVVAAALFLTFAFCGGCTSSQSATGPTSSGGGPAPSAGSHEYQSDDVLQSYLDPHRDEYQRPDEVMQKLGLRGGEVVADVGSGSGYFTWHFSKAVGARGKVLAVDTDPRALEFLQRRLKTEPPPFANIQSVQSTYEDTRLAPASVDLGFLCEAHFMIEKDARSIACLKTLRRALKPGGRVAVIEAKDDPLRGRVPVERLTQGFEAAGFKVDKVIDMYEKEHFVIFK